MVNFVKMCLVILVVIITQTSLSSSGKAIIPIQEELEKLPDGNIFIRGYHFHTYFDHRVPSNVLEAVEFRSKIQKEINSGELKECRINFMNFLPRGPHSLAEWETCCNSTFLPAAMSFFMQNRGNLSVLFHPLTRWELEDHTNRAMFLGPPVTLNVSVLSIDLFDDVDSCKESEMEFTDPDNLIL